MAYSSVQISDILLKADKTMYKLGDVAYENMFDELDEAYDYERDIIFIYKKAVEYGDNYFVGTLKLDQIVERLAAKLNIYDYGTLAPIYVDVYTQVDQGLNIIYVLKTTSLDLGPGLTGSTDFSQSQIDIDIDYAYLNNVYVIDERTLTINGVTYNLSANRTWTLNLDSVTDQGSVTTNSITVGSVYLTNMTAGSGALYYGVGANRLTLANYNAGGSVYIEVNGGQYSAVFGSDLSFTSYGTIAGVFNNATVDTDKFIVSDGGVLKYRTGTQLLSDIGGQPAGNYVLESRTLTINGTTYDLSANRTWNVGTVTGTGTNSYLALWNSSTGLTTSGILQVSTAGYYFDTNSDFGSNFNFRNNATNSMTYAIELINYASPKATKHTYTSGIVISEIANSFVSRIFANGNHIIGSGITDNGYKLEVQGTGRFTGSLTLDTIVNATVDTDKFLVSDGGIVKYRTGAEVLSDIGAQAAGSYVPTSRILTINGTSYDLSADRNWSVGTVTSVDMTVPTGFAISGNPVTSTGTLALAFASGYSLPTNASQTNWDTAYNDKINSASVTGTTTKTLTLNQQDGGVVQASWSDLDTGLTSVGLSMPSAFTVSNSPLTSNGTIAVTGAGLATQYVRGDGSLADFPTGGGGGGASVNYYLNGSVNQGTFGGNVYYEMNKTPILGAGTNFSTSSNGYIAQFITDPNDPALLKIPGGNWNFETFFSASSGGGTPTYYLELYKYDGTTLTLIASSSTSPDVITGGTAVEAYFSTLAVPETILTATDRLAIRIYVTTVGRTITLHTEDNNLCQIITTFSTGLTALNSLTDQVQYFATGTSGSDFNISSISPTHTFNLPTASSSVRGALSTGDWTTFNNKQSAITLTTTGASGSSTFISNTLNIPTYTIHGLGGVPETRTLTINGTTYDLSTDRIWNVGTVTSVTLATGTAGTDVNISNPTITSSGTITLNIPTASATNRGVLSAADWTKFNNNVPAGVPSVGDYVFFNGSNLAYRGIIANSPLSYNSSTATFSISQASGTTNGFLSSTDWTTFNNKQSALANPVTGTGTSGQVAYFNGTTTITGESNLFWDATNDRLGIGITTPGAKLEILGTSSDQLRLSTASTEHYRIGRNASTGFLDLYGSQTGYTGYTFGGVDGTRFTIDETGAARFFKSVKTNVFFGFSAYTTDSDEFGMWATTGTGGGTTLSTSGATNLRFRTNNAERMRISSGGNLLVGGTTDDGYKLDITGNSLFRGDVTIDSAKQLYLLSGDIRYSSNAGFGIVSQNGNRLVSIQNGAFGVSGTGTFSSKITTNANNEALRLQSTDTNGNYITFHNGTAAYAYIGSNYHLTTSGSASDLGIRSEGNLIFDAGGSTERMRLTSSGNLGLGVTPSAWSAGGSNIEVGSAGNIIQGQASQIAVIQNATFNSGWKYSANGFASFVLQTSGQHQWFTAPSGTAGNAITFTQAMTLDASGRLGIGTTSPSVSLDVNGSGIRIVNATSPNLYINNTVVQWKAYMPSSTNNFVLNDAVRDVLTLGYNGAASYFQGCNVGIGTSSPAYPLDIVGFANSTSGFRVTDGTLDNRISWSSGNVGFFGTISNHPIAFNTNASERLRITSGGNLLVGTTTNSGYKLAVNGTANITNALYLNGVEFAASDGTANYIKTGAVLYYQSGSSVIATLSSAGAATFKSTIKTDATGWSAGAWKLGTAQSGTPSTNHYITVEIDGQVYSIPALQGTP